MQGQTLEGGFTEPVFGAQQTFRALMDALANPGQPQALSAPLEAPAGLASELAAVALTLCDHDTTTWLDTELMESEAVLAWLRFHTASPVTTDPTRATFALVSSADALPALEQFALGTDEYPDYGVPIFYADAAAPQVHINDTYGWWGGVGMTAPFPNGATPAAGLPRR